MRERILLCGATGNTGRVVAELLRERGHEYVGMTRSEARRRELEELGIAAVMGDFDAPESLDAALRGITSAYLVCTPDEHLIRREVSFIRAAKRAGVRRIVKCSAYGADVLGPSQNLRSHGSIEGELWRSGLEHTVVRPHGFMQTFTLLNWPMITKAGAMSLPAGDGGIPLVDVRDVAEVVARALTEPGHDKQAYDLTGPEVLDMHAQARVLARELGRPVRYIPGSERQLVTLMRLLGVPSTASEHAVAVFRMQRAHEYEVVSPALRELGIEARTYTQFVRDLIAGRTGGGSSFEPPGGLIGAMMDKVMPAMLRTYVRITEPRASATALSP